MEQNLFSNEADLQSSHHSVGQTGLGSSEFGILNNKGLQNRGGGINQVDEEDEAMEESKN